MFNCSCSITNEQNKCFMFCILGQNFCHNPSPKLESKVQFQVKFHTMFFLYKWPFTTSRRKNDKKNVWKKPYQLKIKCGYSVFIFQVSVFSWFCMIWKYRHPLELLQSLPDCDVSSCVCCSHQICCFDCSIWTNS